MVRDVVFRVLACVGMSSIAGAQFVPGDLYVGATDKIYHVDPTTWSIDVFADASDGLTYATSVAFSPSDTLLCSDYALSEIFEFDGAGSGSVLYDSSDGISGPGGENGLAFDASSSLFISNLPAHTILSFPPGGGTSTVFADSSDGVSFPAGLAFAASGDLLVAEAASNSVLTIDPAGTSTVFDVLPDTPYSIVIRNNADIYVSTFFQPNGVSVYRYPSGDVTQRLLFASFPSSSGPAALQFSLDQHSLYLIAYDQGALFVIDADTASATQVTKQHKMNYSYSIAVFGTYLHAAWSNYGTGFSGTNGVPALTSRVNPTLGTTVTVDVDNSYGQPTIGLLFVGFQQTSIHSGLGGDLLVVPTITLPISFSYGGDWFDGDLPNDARLAGTKIDLQVIEADPGAAKGVSFTQGLELVLGY